jgi:hypothetical protein
MRRHAKREEREWRRTPFGKNRGEWGQSIATKRQRRLCERHGHRRSKRGFSYSGAMIPLMGGDGLVRRESGQGWWCDRCHETFYTNVEYTAYPVPIVSWSGDHNADEWAPDSDEWKQ